MAAAPRAAEPCEEHPEFFTDRCPMTREHLRTRLLALADSWDREHGPGFRHPHAIELRDALGVIPGGDDA